LIQQFRFLEVSGYLSIPDIQRIGTLSQRDGKYNILSVLENAIPVDPALFCIFDIVVSDE
jgi:hypothetical protein